MEDPLPQKFHPSDEKNMKEPELDQEEESDETVRKSLNHIR